MSVDIMTKSSGRRCGLQQQRGKIADVKQKKLNIENVRGVNGTFFQKDLKSLNQLANFINKKCQTITYFGFNNNRFKKLLTDNSKEKTSLIGQSCQFPSISFPYPSPEILISKVSFLFASTFTLLS